MSGRSLLALTLVTTFVVFTFSGVTSSVSHCSPSALPLSNQAAPSRPPRVERGRCGFLVIDAQPSFVRHMAGNADPILERIEQMLLLADLLQTPLIATFEKPTSRNGLLPERLESAFPAHGRRLEKRFFDATREAPIAEALREWKLPQVIVVGAETDVCVLQTVLGLIDKGFEVFLVTDAVFSNEANVAPALERMTKAGAVPLTYKTLFYELIPQAGIYPENEGGEIAQRWERLKGRLKDPYSLKPSKAH